MRIDIPISHGAEFDVPDRFSRLYDLAYNLWWSWDEAGSDVWRALDAELWERYRNPVEVLRGVEKETWQRLEDSMAFTDAYGEAVARFDAYMNSKTTWWDRHQPGPEDSTIAYLCSEYGIHSSVPIYSGGLGILAGDHAKSASDLGLPFVAVGLMYRRGYFRQTIDANGAQQNFYDTLDLSRLPVRPVASNTGGHLKVKVEFPGRIVKAAVWLLQVGRVPILLLDTDIAANEPADRPITHSLYVRGREMRFCQELILGVGSVRALGALGIEPTAWHVNEGHAAMSLLERLSDKVKAGSTLEEAERSVRESTLFTLHTPVPAGNERFDFRIAEKYLSYWPPSVGTDLTYLNQLGTSRKGDEANFDLGALAIRLASITNGVSKRHGEVVAHDWAHLLSSPALGITNGVHTPSWVSRPIGRLITQVVGTDWPTRLIEEPELVELLRELPDDQVWAAHQLRKEMVSQFVRGRIRKQWARHGASPDDLRSVERLFSADRLTIGFARRFATYKRATLLFHNVPWLQAILTNPDRPVQLLFAGKAHPADAQGQGLIRQIHDLANSPELKGHIYILEDYDMRMGRFLTQGVDVWLNNPRPPQEASGTSGMKAALNGVLNLSVLDGWWVEAANSGKNGWAFGHANDIGDHSRQDSEDAVALYQILQDAIVPLFYDRNDNGVPIGWVQLMKESIASCGGEFSTHRMVEDYVKKAYALLG
ncbi:MAG: alpha-glucan family phosphorylase [Acidimicrobiia bacterium]|nr:alpha-glucan family phosphorylase [Acidimicrobiia bacterium]